MTGNEWFTIENALGKVIDNQWGSQNKGTKYWAYSKNGTPAQNFKVVQKTGSNWVLSNQRSNLCLDMSGGTMNDNGSLIQWDCHKGANQNWTFEKVQSQTTTKQPSTKGPSPQRNNNNNQLPGLTLDTWVTIKSLHSQKCLSVAQGTIKQFTCNPNDNAMRWKIKISQKGAPWITLESANGKVLDNQWGSTNKKTKYWSYDRNGTPAQNFKIQKSSQGHWYLQNERSNLCLDVMDWSKQDGGELIQWDCLSNQANQNWIIEAVPEDKKLRTDNNNLQNPQHHHKQGELDNGYFQIRNGAEKCLKDNGVGLPISFSDCNDKDDGLFFQFKKSRNGRAYYVVSALGNSISYSSGKLLSAVLKQDKSQKFRISEKADSGIFKFKTLGKQCISTENSLSLTPCKKKTASQRLALYAYTKIFLKK